MGENSGNEVVQRIVQLVSLILIHRIVIYLVDSAIQRLNNQGENLSFSLLVRPYLAKYMVCHYKAAMLAVNS